jgi:hypothetical protein
MYDKKHLYEEKIKGLNKTVIYYCQKHYEWETIKIRYTKDGIKYLVVNDICSKCLEHMDELIKGEIK